MEEFFIKLLQGFLALPEVVKFIVLFGLFGVGIVLLKEQFFETDDWVFFVSDFSWCPVSKCLSDYPSFGGILKEDRG